jgi:hypothetical protein
MSRTKPPSTRVGVERRVHFARQRLVHGRRLVSLDEQRLMPVTAHQVAQQRVVAQVDLPHRQVVGGAPVRVDVMELVVGQGTG